MVLPGAYFLPHAEDIWWMSVMLKHQRPYPFAITFGEVTGPFTADHTMPRLRSLRSASYKATTILCRRACSGNRRRL